MLEGFYKVRFQVDEAVGRSVMYCHDGIMLGGNSAFAHYGTYSEADGVITSEITSHRHNDDPNYQSLLGSDIAKIDVRGSADGDTYRFRGGSPQMPGAVFQSVMTPIVDEIVPPMDAVGEGGIVNGLYSVHIRMLDGIDGGLTGVMLLHDGRILGGDAFFYYLGTYTSANGRWRGEILNQEHTSAKSEHPIFGGHEVGIGFAGTCDTGGAMLEATALAGKRSLRLTAVLKLMRPA
ncbi:MAG: GrlR family regulatory protein [Pseudomonadota bacterium]